MPDESPFEDDVRLQRVPPELMVATVLAVIVGVVLRFVTRTPLWLDEALSVNIAKLPLGEIPNALSHDGHPPLYYVLLHGWMKLAGSGDAAVRALSGLFAVVTLPLAYLAGRRRGGVVLGTLAVLVLALNPFALRYANEARMYSLLMALVLVGYLLVDDVVRRDRGGWPRHVALAVVSGLLLLTHYWSMWLLGSVLVTLLVVWRRSPDEELRRRAGRAALAVAAGGVALVPWLGVLATQAAHTGTPWAKPTRPPGIIGITFLDYGGGGGTADPLFAALLLFLAAVLGVTARALGSGRMELDLRSQPRLRWEAAIVGGTFVIAATVSFITGAAFASRYTAVVFPLVMLLVAGGLASFTPRWVLDIAAALVVGSMLVGAVWTTITPRTQARVNAAAIEARAQPGDLVIYCPDQLGPSHQRELSTGLRQVSYPAFDDPRFVNWTDYAERNAAADPAAFADRAVAEVGSDQRIYVVWAGIYRTFDGQCEQLIAELAARRGAANPLVSDQGDKFYEHAGVVEVSALGP